MLEWQHGREKEIISHSRAVLAGIYSYQDTTGISKDKP